MYEALSLILTRKQGEITKKSPPAYKSEAN